MLSCTDLYNISARTSNMYNKLDESFDGIHVILAGDFTQLSPVAGGSDATLYNGKIGTWLSALTSAGQKNLLERVLWHQFITVVILWKNIHQRGISAEDSAFWVALENLQYHSYTDNNIKLFQLQIVDLM